jgi:3-hydroxybutyryl-CoA dehydratase
MMTMLEGLVLGQTVTLTVAITDADVALFALITKDHHPLHLDASYAEKTHFGQRIVPTSLISGVIEAALAETLPHTLAMVRSQELDLIAPLPVDATVMVAITLLTFSPEEQCARCAVVVARDDGTEIARAQVRLSLEDLPPLAEDEILP